MLAGNDPDLMLRCLRTGATDFLIQPFTAEQLEAASGKLARLQPAAESGRKEPAKIFAVMPAKGACGATTVACNLAFQWKRLGAKRILLADLDPLAGTMSFLLKIKSVYSFVDVLNHAHELDSRSDGIAMVTPVGGVDVPALPEGRRGACKTCATPPRFSITPGTPMTWSSSTPEASTAWT